MISLYQNSSLLSKKLISKQIQINLRNVWFINGICNVSTLLKYVLFADDTNLL